MVVCLLLQDIFQKNQELVPTSSTEASEHAVVQPVKPALDFKVAFQAQVCAHFVRFTGLCRACEK